VYPDLLPPQAADDVDAGADAGVTVDGRPIREVRGGSTGSTANGEPRPPGEVLSLVQQAARLILGGAPVRPSLSDMGLATAEVLRRGESEGLLRALNWYERLCPEFHAMFSFNLHCGELSACSPLSPAQRRLVREVGQSHRLGRFCGGDLLPLESPRCIPSGDDGITPALSAVHTVSEAALGLEFTPGDVTLIRGVASGGQAARLGISAGDRIAFLNNAEVIQVEHGVTHGKSSKQLSFHTPIPPPPPRAPLPPASHPPSLLAPPSLPPSLPPPSSFPALGLSLLPCSVYLCLTHHQAIDGRTLISTLTAQSLPYTLVVTPAGEKCLSLHRLTHALLNLS
jgi:hypothetical protein